MAAGYEAGESEAGGYEAGESEAGGYDAGGIDGKGCSNVTLMSLRMGIRFTPLETSISFWVFEFPMGKSSENKITLLSNLSHMAIFQCLLRTQCFSIQFPKEVVDIRSY